MEKRLRHKLDKLRLIHELEVAIKVLEKELKGLHPSLEGERNKLGKQIMVKKELLDALIKERTEVEEKKKDDMGLLTHLGDKKD